VIITLYQNSQTEAESPRELYQDQWALAPYTANSLFCSGKTSTQADFILPVDFSFDPATGSIRYRNKYPCVLRTGKDGNPFVYIDNAFSPSVILQLHIPKQTPPLYTSPSAESPKDIPARLSTWIPGCDANGELEIF